MKEQPLVSVLMTSYNREKYIAEAIESVINSTYQNWELIIVDDCSKDKTVEIAKSYEAKDYRIKVYLNEKNLGDYPNRNKAASYARGKYIKYVDADDLIYPHCLEVMVRDIEKFPDAAIAICTYDDDIIPLPKIQSPNEVFKEHFFQKDVFGRSPLGVIIKKNIFNELKGFSGKRFVGDTEMWMKIASKYNVVRTVMGVAFWRSHGEQEFVKGNLNFSYPILNCQLLFDCLMHFCPLSEVEKKMIINNFKRKESRKLIKNIIRARFYYGLKLYLSQNLTFFDLFYSFKRFKKPE